MQYCRLLTGILIIAGCWFGLAAPPKLLAQRVSAPLDSLRLADSASLHPKGLLAPKSLLVQFVSSEAAYAVPFWSITYPRLKRIEGHFSNFPDPIAVLGLCLGLVSVPVVSNLTLDLLGWKTGNISGGLAGSMLGPLIARLTISSDKTYIPILFSGVASVLFSMLFSDLGASSD